MHWTLRLFGSLVLAMTLSGAASSQDLENTLYMDLATGRVVIQLRPDLAPKHVARIKELARAGFYDGIIFHRVIDGFMAQTGDPTGTGAAAPTSPTCRPSSRSSRSSAARSAWPGPPIRTAPTASSSSVRAGALPNGQYTVWGQVVDGMQYVDQLPRASRRAIPTRSSTCGSRPTSSSDRERPRRPQRRRRSSRKSLRATALLRSLSRAA